MYDILEVTKLQKWRPVYWLPVGWKGKWAWQEASGWGMREVGVAGKKWVGHEGSGRGRKEVGVSVKVQPAGCL